MLQGKGKAADNQKETLSLDQNRRNYLNMLVLVFLLLGNGFAVLGAPRMLGLYETKGGNRPRPIVTQRPVTQRIVTYPTYPTKGQVKQVTKDPCIGKEYSADPKNCNVFFQCSGGKMVKLPCPPGLHWNQQEKMCDWPHKVNRPECPASATSQTCNTAPNSEGFRCSKPTGLFPVSNDCKSFYMCDHCKATKKPCPKGLAWNQKLTTCDWPENVKGCKVVDNNSQNTQAPVKPQRPVTQATIRTVRPTNANIKGGFAGNLMSSNGNSWSNSNNMWSNLG